MQRTITEADFGHSSWHDCHIWGLDLYAGNPDENDWTSDLLFNIDFIVEWLCGVDGGGKFRVAPATLTFHGVSDLRILVDWGDSGFQVALHELSIDKIDRELVTDQKVFFDRQYYKWIIRLNWPQDGEISFGAMGFTQTLLAEPVLTFNQYLSRPERRRLTKQ